MPQRDVEYKFCNYVYTYNDKGIQHLCDISYSRENH